MHQRKWPFRISFSDASALLRYDIGQDLVLERVPAVRRGGDPQRLHGAWHRSAALREPQHGGGSVPGRAVSVTVRESQDLWMDDPVVPTQLLKADFNLCSVAVAVARPVQRGALEQVDSRRRPGNDNWCMTG